MTVWATSSPPTTTWPAASPDFKETWADWSAYTWGQLTSSGVTWAAMAGYTFVNTSYPTTTWVATT